MKYARAVVFVWTHLALTLARGSVTGPWYVVPLWWCCIGVNVALALVWGLWVNGVFGSALATLWLHGMVLYRGHGQSR